MRRSVTVFALVGLFLCAAAGRAGPASALFTRILCPPGPQPGGCSLAVAEAGEALTVQVYVVDAGGGLPTNFLGTVSFSSSDPLATLPAAYTFGPEDAALGFHRFPGVVLRTIGTQSITATDVPDGLTPGTAVLTVLAAAEPVPASSRAAWVLFAVLLGVAGAWLLRSGW